MSKKAVEKINLCVSLGEENVRADVFLAKKLSDRLSRARIKSLIDQKLVKLNGKTLEKASAKVHPFDAFQVEIPAPEKWQVEPENIPLKIVFEDGNYLVINKPRGLAVHPAAGHRQGTLVNAVLAHAPDLAGIGGEIRPGIVHRLDKDTTGLLVVAKTEMAFKELQKQIKEGKVKRQYLALVKGRLPQESGVVDAPIGRHPVDRKKMAVVEEGRGRKAITDYRVLIRFGNEYSLLLLKLRTGRTHQIRVHMAYIGHPVVGDWTYSRTKKELGLEGQALHALRLGFFNPGEPSEYVEYSAALPDDFRWALETLEKRYKEEIPKWILTPKAEELKEQ